jgi:predicted ATPase
MVLKKVVLENYRSCIETSINLHPSLSVFIGPNSSGKTNILQGMMILNKFVTEDPYTFHTSESGSVSSGLKATLQVHRTTVDLNASVAAFTDNSNNDLIRGSRQKWSLKERNGQRASFDYPLGLIARYSERGIPEVRLRRHYPLVSWRVQRNVRVQELDKPKWAWKTMYQIASFCRGMTYYGASQFTNPGACPASFEIEQEGGQRTLTRFRGHAKVLYDMYSAERGKDREAYSRFLEIVGPKGLRLIDSIQFKQVETSSTDYSVRVGGKVEFRKRNKLLIVPQFKIGKQKLSPNQLSEGTFKTLALLFHIITEKSTILLIEEPEVCVHHGLLSSILELIKSASERKQIILSTHSDYVLDHVAPENVYRVSRDRLAGTIAKPIRSTMTSQEYSALRDYLNTEGNLGEFWREGGLGDRQ